MVENTSILCQLTQIFYYSCSKNYKNFNFVEIYGHLLVGLVKLNWRDFMATFCVELVKLNLMDFIAI
jgi:hypothetical protein